jgi:Putative ATPase subunit of terminase (gpP-like)
MAGQAIEATAKANLYSMLGQGASKAAIARQLGIDWATVAKYARQQEWSSELSGDPRIEFFRAGCGRQDRNGRTVTWCFCNKVYVDLSGSRLSGLT